MKITRNQLRSLIKEAISDLDYFDQGKVFAALKAIPAAHRKKVENFLNNTLKITADRFNKIEDDESITSKIKTFVKEYKADSNIDNLINNLKDLLQ